MSIRPTIFVAFVCAGVVFGAGPAPRAQTVPRGPDPQAVSYCDFATAAGAGGVFDLLDPDAQDVSTSSAPGLMVSAINYYLNIGFRLGLNLTVGTSGPALGDIVEFLGYPGLSGRDLETEPPDRLMPATAADFADLAAAVRDPAAFSALSPDDFAPGRVLAVRYFAPKVANYNKKQIAHVHAGWRKLVYLRARDGSAARAAGIEAGFVLFNYLESPLDTDLTFGVNDIFPTRASPPEAFSPTIQVILQADFDQAETANRPSLLFLAFAGASPQQDDTEQGIGPYGLSPALRANFDLTEAYEGLADKKYHVPDACMQCHGLPFTGATVDTGNALGGPASRRLRLNFLDTDLWHDMRDTPDFAALDRFDVPVLVDVLPDGSNHARVFDRFRQLNRIILRQNLQAGGPRPETTPNLRSVWTWMRNHAVRDDRVRLWDRVLTPLTPTEPWNEADPADAALLQRLDRFCSRCHADMFFSIYDKGSFLLRAAEAYERLFFKVPDDRKFERMPQGREIPPAELAALRGYLETVMTRNGLAVPVEPQGTE